jgi:hypothetical protein
MTRIVRLGVPVELKVIFELAGSLEAPDAGEPAAQNAHVDDGRFSAGIATSVKVRLQRRHHGNYKNRNRTNESGTDS